MSSFVGLSTLGTVMLVGAGKMGMAMAQGWLKAGLKADQLVLVDPNPSDQTVDFAGAHGLLLLSKIQAAPVGVLVLAVKPQIMDAVYADAKLAVGADTLVLSIAAGISIETLTGGLGTDRLVRTMPNTPAQVGKGVTGAVAGAGVNADDRLAAAALLSAAGALVWLEDESQIDALTAVSGSGPAYVFHMVEAMAAAGVAEGLPEGQAMMLARQTVIGAAALMEQDPTDAATLRQNVTSPNGVTAEALAVLMADDGLIALMKKAISAAKKRSIELGQ